MRLSGPCAAGRQTPIKHATISSGTRKNSTAYQRRHQQSKLSICYSRGESGTDGVWAENLYNSVVGTPKTGSEYGEGFVHYRFAGEPSHLDVETLNERLQPQGAVRLRQALKPDEAFGMIFNFDNVIVDTRQLQRRAWAMLADQENLPFPALERPQLYNLKPERVITEVLMWTRDWGVAQRLSWQLAGIYADLFKQLHQPQPGVREWLQALGNFNVPCAVVSSMDRASVRTALERMGLYDYFMIFVTAEDDMETVSQRYLSAAMQLQRPPNLCVAFDSSPQGITAAHNCTMKAVAVYGNYRAWELQSADIACGSLSELSVYNVRRMFANRGAEFMDYMHDWDNNKPKDKRPVAGAVLDPI